MRALSAEQIGLVRGSFDSIAPQAAAFVDRFYGRLFSLRPDLRALFRRPLKDQGRMLASALAAVVASLEHLDVIAPALRELGGRHAAYGVREEDYADVGDALLWTLEAALGAAFGAELRRAWTDAYGVIADTMKAGAAAVAPQRRVS